jgi:uncharacterized protein YwgA
MTILTRNIILIALFCFGKKVKGKTRLQKLLYFLAELLRSRYNEDPRFSHNAYYYGPYSSTISDDLTKLVNYRLVLETVENYGTRNSAGFEVRSFDYELTPAAEQAIKWIKEHYTEEVRHIEKIAEELAKFADMDYTELSIAAKAHWILKEINEPMTADSVAREAKRLSWDVTDKQIEKGFHFLQKIRLIKDTLPAPND